MPILKNGIPLTEKYCAVCDECGQSSQESFDVVSFIDKTGHFYETEAFQDKDGSWKTRIICKLCSAKILYDRTLKEDDGSEVNRKTRREIKEMLDKDD